ncbi:uncharacterized protein LAESUDRAFT_692854 [Laetiporus sulphureus 93-53]|uniref:Protein kinase domain-containing protein n=1 Tax=Laetiporus sulphureus 93-53 TaxID=1314785 RepID=A0A165GPT4_9APHY|nr:uncharacterized protein LAESUDRAFT_692854 [Laetiporus sulphureus 93-53]KZT10641.1 hypothetical protein LAESUDRAFT_692854 [Laetiporus sulphureus 93-53]
MTDVEVFPALVEGATLRIVLRPSAPSSTEDGVSLCARVTHTYSPFTMSPVLRVSIDPLRPSALPPSSSPFPTEAILKLYDRRCLTNTRVDYDDGRPWSLDEEREHWQYLVEVERGAAKVGDFASPTYMWDNDVSDGAFEAYLAYTAPAMFAAERAAYECLNELQGKEIPRLYGVVEWEVVPGILIEYVSGLTLRQLVQTWPRRTPTLSNVLLAHLCDRAVAVVDHMSDFDVLNEDVRLDNFLIREPFLELVEYPVVLVDLAQCRLRCAEEDEDAWVAAKWSQDETGAVGFVLLSLVQECVGKDVWSFKRSLRYYRPLEG